MKNQEVWFSNPLFMNDLEEVRFGINEGARFFLTLENIGTAAQSKHRLDLLYPNSEILTHGAQRCAGMIAL